MEQEFYQSVKSGSVEEVKELLRNNPTLNVNWRHADGTTALHRACEFGHDSVLGLLRAHLGIDINQKDNDGNTPFVWACFKGRLRCVRALLADPRVKVNEPNDYASTPLWVAAYNGHVSLIKWWVALGCEVDGTTAAIEGALTVDFHQAEVRQAKEEVVALLQKFQENPLKTRQEVRVELGWYDEIAAGVFALVVFNSDGLLKSKAAQVKAKATRTRFFNIAGRLPLELQMVLCYRVAGSAKEIIPGRQTEAAFRDLARCWVSQ